MSLLLLFSQGTDASISVVFNPRVITINGTGRRVRAKGPAMSRLLIRSGYDFSRSVTVSLDGAPESLTGAAVKCSLKNALKTVELIADTAQSSASVGADWLNGILVIQFPASTTSALTAQNAWIEVSVVKSGIRVPCEDIPAVVELGYAVS